MYSLNIKGKLIGKIIIDWCNKIKKENKDVSFKESMCSGYQKIRFVTKTLNSVLQKNECEQGYILCYEIVNQDNNLVFTVKLERLAKGNRAFAICEKLAKAAGVSYDGEQSVSLASWNVSDEAKQDLQISGVLDQLFEYEVSYFEQQLGEWIVDNDKTIKAFPQYEQQLLAPQELPDEIFIEGSMKDILTNRYERNVKARSRCLAHYGPVCQICGMDFSKTYGECFKGIVEVHHRKPLNEIKQDYIVDPVKDLIPVCPNCHRALHSKPDGVYTAEEIKMIMLKESSDQYE